MHLEYLEDRQCLSTIGATLFEDNFNLENGGFGSLNYANLANWSITRGSVDLIGNGFFDFYPGNGLYLDLDGSTSSGGRLESTSIFMLVPGAYQLEFSLGNNASPDPTNSARVTLAGVYDEVFMRTGAVPLETVTRQIAVTASASGRLIFDQLGADNGGLILDNVRLIRLDQPPTDVTLSSSTVPENSATGTVVGNLTAIDADAGDTHTFTLVNSAGGRFKIVGNQLQVDDGTLLDFEAVTSHTIRVRATDADGLSFEKDLTITVTNVNEAPVNTVPGPMSTRPNRALVFSALNGNPISIADVDAGTSPVEVTLSVTNGTLTLGTTASLSFSAGDGTSDAVMTFTGTITAVNAALDGLRYDPASGFSGVANVTITTNDQGHSGAGSPLADTDSVAITVSASASADLSVTLLASPNPVRVGGLLTYTATVRNDGPFTATGVTLSDFLPEGVAFVSATASPGTGCSLVGSTVICHLGSLASGASATVTIVVRPMRHGMIANRVRVQGIEFDAEPDDSRAIALTMTEVAP